MPKLLNKNVRQAVVKVECTAAAKLRICSTLQLSCLKADPTEIK